MTFVSKKLLKASSAIAKSIDFPDDSFSDGGFMELAGNHEIKIYSAKTILKFSSELVCISCPFYVLRVKGKGLNISGFVGGSLTVNGTIIGIEFDGDDNA